MFSGQPPFWWAAGAIALLSLIASLTIPVWVFLGGLELYNERFALMRTWLPLLAILYFVSGTYWAVKGRKPETGEH